MKILFISLSQRLKNSDAVIIALSYGGLFIHQLKRIKHGNGCRICLNSTLIIKYIYIIILYNYIYVVWFICNTILYNNVACMRLLCSIVYICMYCGIICHCAPVCVLVVNSAFMRFYGIYAPGYSIIGNKPVIHGNIYE